MRISDWSSDVCSSDLVWLNGMEVTQFTYFQQVGGLECRPVAGEITYGLERLAMYIQKVESVYDLVWARDPVTGREVSYGDVYHQNEVEQSTRSEEHTSELQSLMHNSYAVFCLKKKKHETK